MGGEREGEASVFFFISRQGLFSSIRPPWRPITQCLPLPPPPPPILISPHSPPPPRLTPPPSLNSTAFSTHSSHSSYPLLLRSLFILILPSMHPYRVITFVLIPSFCLVSQPSYYKPFITVLSLYHHILSNPISTLFPSKLHFLSATTHSHILTHTHVTITIPLFPVSFFPSQSVDLPFIQTRHRAIILPSNCRSCPKSPPYVTHLLPSLSPLLLLPS